MSQHDVIVIGAGIAGLSAAIHARAAGREVLILEASDGIGGRVRTDRIDGFQLDRGFQILLTAYPEAQRMLDYAALDLRTFTPGSLVWCEGAFQRVTDPFRQPMHAPATLGARVGSLWDKLRVLRLRLSVCRGELDSVWTRPDVSTLEMLRAQGFSETFIDRFWRPFLGGVFFDPDLETSARMAAFVVRMFSNGDNAVPARGMGAIADQLAAKLPEGAIRLSHPVRAVEPGVVRLDDQELTANHVIVATDPHQASELLSLPAVPFSRTSTLWFAADEPPITEPTLALDGTRTGPVNHLAVMDQVSSAYAPQGRSLVAANVLDLPGDDITANCRTQLRTWFGPRVQNWELLRIDRIPHALPRFTAGHLPRPTLDTRVAVAGDHTTHGSLQGAMVSGRRAALSLG